MQRIFLDRSQISGSTAVITGQDAYHIRNVLRMKPGEQFLVSCQDSWEYTCRITGITPDQVTAEIVDASKPGKELPSRITLFQCLPKGDKMETVIQKAVELGAYAVVPVASKRCVVRLDAKKAAAKNARWNSIAENAARQAKRMIIPQVLPLQSFAQALETAAETDVRLLPYECAEGMGHTREALAGIRPGQTVSVLIGPEGGFEEEEVRLAEAAGFTVISLGRRILRTETAGMALLSALMLQLEED